MHALVIRNNTGVPLQPRLVMADQKMVQQVETGPYDAP